MQIYYLYALLPLSKIPLLSMPSSSSSSQYLHSGATSSSAYQFWSGGASQRPSPLSTSYPYRRTMSGFLSSEAEQALQAEEAEAQRLFYEAMMHDQQQTRRLYPQSPSSPYPPISRVGVPYVQQPAWSSTYASSTMSTYPATQHTPIVPSSPYVVPSSADPKEWPTNSWNALHPEEYQGSRSRAASGSDYSRSSSPNPAELRNFGYPLPDGRSWRCAHPGCTSQAVFTRGCDLRKHFRRHTKTLFCRHEDCRQSTDAFSSKKDRDRHEAKHKPGVVCQYQGCERVFSRVDNMKDHMRRIHYKSG